MIWFSAFTNFFVVCQDCFFFCLLKSIHYFYTFRVVLHPYDKYLLVYQQMYNCQIICQFSFLVKKLQLSYNACFFICLSSPFRVIIAYMSVSLCPLCFLILIVVNIVVLSLLLVHSVILVCTQDF